jgi:ATP-binding cassette, subfamily C (CFTR/MRP), member 4
VTVTFSTIIRYFKQSQKFIVLILTVAMFAASEILYSLFYRTFGNYDYDEGSHDDLFRNAGIILAIYLLTTISKYYLMAFLTYLANKHIHEDMTLKLLRAPISYFERNPSGRIVNKFAGDIGTMDFLLFFMFTDTTENPITFLNLMITVTIYNPYFLLLAFLYAILLCVWFLYSK